MQADALAFPADRFSEAVDASIRNVVAFCREFEMAPGDYVALVEMAAKEPAVIGMCFKGAKQNG